MAESKSYTIVCFIKELSFPLREAIRKQIWWLAEQKKNEGYRVTIKIFSDRQDSFENSGIKVEYFSRNSVADYVISAEVVHYITSVVELRLIFSMLSKGKKFLTLGDGEPLAKNKVFLRRILIKLLEKTFSKIFVYSKYQKEKLRIENVELTSPILPKIDGPSRRKHQFPTMLYMGHLSHFKGVRDIFYTFSTLISEIPNLRLVIADNMVHSDKVLTKELYYLRNSYPNNVIIKGIIDPIDELSEAWVYIYPFIEAGGTLSYALSLYESLRCGTPFIACDVGANSEFFPKEYLIMPSDRRSMVDKCRKLIENEL